MENSNGLSRIVFIFANDLLISLYLKTMQQTVFIRGYYLSPLQGFGSASASSAQSAVKNLCAFCALLRQIKSASIGVHPW
jgi:hypothetical protein